MSQWRQGLENVDLVGLYDSAVDLVEKIHQYERVENHCVQNESIGWRAVQIPLFLQYQVE